MELLDLQLGRHKLAYERAVKAQRYLRREELGLKILNKSFSRLTNLKTVTFDHSIETHVFLSLVEDFGWSDSELLNSYEFHVIPTIIRALSESRATATELRIGCGHDFAGPRYQLRELGAVSHRLTVQAMRKIEAIATTFKRPSTLVHAQQVLSNVRILKVGESSLDVNQAGFIRLIAAIKHIVSYMPHLEHAKIAELRCADPTVGRYDSWRVTIAGHPVREVSLLAYQTSSKK